MNSSARFASVCRPSEDRWVDLGLERFAAALRETKHLRTELTAALTGSSCTDAQLLILWRCESAAALGISQVELAQQLAASPAQISVQLEGLRRLGWIVASRGVCDRRRQHWRLTPEGTAELHALRARLADWGAQFAPAERPTLRLFAPDAPPNSAAAHRAAGDCA